MRPLSSRTVDADEDLLRQILGLRRMPYLAQANRVNEVPVLNNQMIERHRIAFRCSYDQRDQLHNPSPSQFYRC